MSKVILNSFVLNKLKLIKNGGLSVDYSVSETESDETYTDSIGKKTPRNAHEDLLNKLDMLSKYVAETNGMTTYKYLDKSKSVGAKLEEAIKTMSSTFKDLEKETLRNIKFTELTITGNDENRSVVIKATNTYNESGIPVQTCSISLNRNKWGWEKELATLIDEILEEVKMFLFEGKFEAPAQTELDLDEDAA